MLVNSFTIHAKLPSLNEVIRENRKNRYAGAKIKKDTEKIICTEIASAVNSGSLVPVNQPCIVHISWYEKTKRRDVDNIQSSQKFILDSLVRCGILHDDGQKYVTQVFHKVVESDEDMVDVVLETEGPS